MGANKSIDVNLAGTSEIQEKKRLYDIDYTVFPDSKTELKERVDYIESISKELDSIGNTFVKKISSLRDEIKLLHIDSKQNKELINPLGLARNRHNTL
jgi:hypothetical protein